jgi:hypothetical protein
MVGIMTKIFITGTIAARVADGKKDIKAVPLTNPDLTYGDPALVKPPRTRVGDPVPVR